MNLFNNIYNGKTVLITGNTGFKGTWLANILIRLGANVIGYALKPVINPNHFEILNLNYKTYFEDINNIDKISEVFKLNQPDIVFHLAAQPLVRYSYQNPIETYRTNVMGTANLLDSARKCESVKAIIVVTTDKCYENIEQNFGYIETDKMGGHDPYSSSKGCVELLTSSFRKSFFNISDYKTKHNTLVASARAGNVIGGGDWSEDRLIPDIIKATLKKKKVSIRNLFSTRPWQHVLEPLNGYLLLGEKLLMGNKEFADAWNFGPEESEVLMVKQILDLANQTWEEVSYINEIDVNNPHEAHLLSLNIEKSKKYLKWNPVWNNEKAVEKTISWYKNFYLNNIISTNEDIDSFYSK
jgi:CDP-glucose 4,6-dehydratase